MATHLSVRTVLAWLGVLAGILAPSAGAAPHESVRLYPVANVQLFARIAGSGPPVLFLHGGLSFFDEAFAGQKDYFSAFRTVVGVDQRGHGHSPDNDQPFSYRQMADDTAALLKSLGLGPVDVVGHSDGGNVGLLLARYHPEAVRRLVISGANLRGDHSGLLAYARLRLQSDEKFTAGLPAPLRAAYARVAPDGDAHWPVFAAKTRQLWLTWSVLEPEELGAIRIPVLVMAGEHDVVPLEHTRSIAQALPRGRLCIIAGSGHTTMRDQAQEFNRLTRAFLEQADGAP